MLKSFYHAFVSIALTMVFGFAGGAIASPTADITIRHSWQGDLIVNIGVGNPDAPLWELNIWNRTGGSANDVIFSDLDISGGSSYLWGYTWYLEVYDGAGLDSGWIENFSITENDVTYSSLDHPSITDYTTSYAYIVMPAEDGNSVPEPGTLLLLGLAGLGLATMRYRRQQ